MRRPRWMYGKGDFAVMDADQKVGDGAKGKGNIGNNIEAARLAAQRMVDEHGGDQSAQSRGRTSQRGGGMGCSQGWQG